MDEVVAGGKLEIELNTLIRYAPAVPAAPPTEELSILFQSRSEQGRLRRRAIEVRDWLPLATRS